MTAFSLLIICGISFCYQENDLRNYFPSDSQILKFQLSHEEKRDFPQRYISRTYRNRKAKSSITVEIMDGRSVLPTVTRPNHRSLESQSGSLPFGTPSGRKIGKIDRRSTVEKNPMGVLILSSADGKMNVRVRLMIGNRNGQSVDILGNPVKNEGRNKIARLTDAEVRYLEDLLASIMKRLQTDGLTR